MFADTKDGETISIDNPLLHFIAAGVPTPQGSKSVWKGRPVETNKAKLMPWRQSIANAAAQGWGDKPLVTGPLEVDYIFRFSRPPSHYGTGRNADKLKPSTDLHHKQKPDIEKLVRAVNDALTKVVWHDDSQVCRSHMRKEWTDGSSGVEVVIRPVT